MLPQLNDAEQKWLDDYREALAKQYPGTVVGMLRYGVKARGYLFDDNELNLLLVTRNEAERLEKEICYLGYGLSDPPETDPTITVWTEREWRRRKKVQSAFQELVEKDGVWL